MKPMIKKTLKYKTLFTLNITGIIINVVKTSVRFLTCRNLKVYQRNEYTLSEHDTTAVVINQTGAVLNYDEYYTKQGKTANASRAIYVCEQPRMTGDHASRNCTADSGHGWVLVEGSVAHLDNGTLLVNISNKIYDPSEFTRSNGSYYVCKDVFVKPVKEVIETTEKKVQSIMTLVCMLVSIVALIYVLITYSLFAELRTPPGINLMNLSVAILLSQVLWLVGSGQSDHVMVCTAMALILHYLFLVSFLWTSIIAYDTWKTFSAKGLPCSQSNRTLPYMAVGWLSVLVFVSVCAALDWTNTVTIGYRSRDACWISNRNAVLYFFVIPFILIFLFNITLYIMTVKAINATSVQARLAADHNCRRRSFVIYVRIGSIMGMTWILGFVASFDPLGFLWYPYIVLNGLQGFYVAVAFGFNQSVIGLYKKLLIGREGKSRGTTSDVSGVRNTGIDDTSL